jgi:polysaccharide export outer membrane protein
MAKFLMRSFELLAVFIILSVALFSCSSTKNTTYFQDIPDSGKMAAIASASYIPLKIQPNDILTVLVETLNPESTAAISLGNLPIPSTGTSLSPVGLTSVVQQTSAGYQVDNNGNINLPVIGEIHVAGYTTIEASGMIKTVALKYYKEPITVIARFANFRVTVSGEVAHPGVYVMPDEKASVMDAIALAGDLTIFGKRENVLLIRQNEDGTKTPYRFNLKKSNIMSSPYYYLRQNDYIYIEPGNGKAAATDASQARNYSIAAALLSVLIVFLTRK